MITIFCNIGIYYRQEINLPDRQDDSGKELYERIKMEIREGIIGTEQFDPTHVAIVTWKNVSFFGTEDLAIVSTTIKELKKKFYY